jgi:hypothetical protein
MVINVIKSWQESGEYKPKVEAVPNAGRFKIEIEG